MPRRSAPSRSHGPSREAALRGADRRVAGAKIRDIETGREIEVRARVTIDATGPWSDEGRLRDDPAAPPRLRLSKGAHVTVPASRLPIRRAVAVPVEAGRLFFAIPSGPVTLLGTTESDYTGPADAVGPVRVRKSTTSWAARPRRSRGPRPAPRS